MVISFVPCFTFFLVAFFSEGAAIHRRHPAQPSLSKQMGSEEDIQEKIFLNYATVACKSFKIPSTKHTNQLFLVHQTAAQQSFHQTNIHHWNPLKRFCSNSPVGR